MKKEFFGTIDGKEVFLYTLQNERLSVSITNYGATLVKVIVPDRNGKPVDVLLGYDSAEEYRTGDANMGALVGRCANRIAGDVTLNGQLCVLEKNEGNNCLHSAGGSTAFQIWEVEEELCDDTHLYLSLRDKERTGGLPGNVDFSLCYELLEEALCVNLSGIPDKTTILNVTSHGYFNLSGNGRIAEQQVLIAADVYTPLLPESHTPDGSVKPVAGTKYDFRTLRPIGEEAYDDNFVLRHEGETLSTPDAIGLKNAPDVPGEAGGLHFAAEAYSTETGIRMKLFTDCPCLQFYTGKFIPKQKGKYGRQYGAFSGFCLEPQFAPDAIHCKDYAQPVVEKGQQYYFQMRLQF